VLKGGVTTAYTYPATNHRLSQAGAVLRTYDAVGNTTRIGTGQTLVYSDSNRLSQLQKRGQRTLAFESCP